MRRCVYVLSQTGNGALQLPEGRQAISGAPISEWLFSHLNVMRAFILLFWLLIARPRLVGVGIGQWTAKKKQI